MTTADGHDKTAARDYGRPSLFGDDRRSSAGDRIGIG
jgi:hypothetical protein